MTKNNMPEKTTGKRVKLRGLGQLYQRAEGGNWHASFSVNGEQFRESTHKEKYNEAVSFLKKRIAEIETGQFTTTKVNRVMVPEILQCVVKDYEIKGREVSLRKMVRPLIKYHLEPAFKHMRAANMNAGHLRKYIQDRQAESAADASINRELAILRRAYTLGTSEGLVNKASVPDFSEVALKEMNTRTGFWSHDEYAAFKQALSEDARSVFVFGYWTGCRYSEIVNLRWDQVDLEGRAVRLKQTQTKSKEPRIIPLGRMGDLYEMLLEQKKRRESLCPESPWVFFRTSKRRLGKRVSNIDKEIDKAQDTTGISRLYHDLRRTGVRNLIRAGVPQSIAKRISGHKTDSVFERYNIVDETDLHDAADKLVKHMTAKANGSEDENKS